MNNFKSTILFLTVLWIGSSLQAQEENLDLVETEIRQITEIEIEAFKTGDCEKATSFMDNNITFYGNGRKVPSKKIIKKFCFGLNRPFEKPSSIETNYYPLSKNSAYVIRTMEFHKDEELYKKEIVTKVWRKGKDGWKIIHLHSTIKLVAEM